MTCSVTYKAPSSLTLNSFDGHTYSMDTAVLCPCYEPSLLPLVIKTDEVIENVINNLHALPNHSIVHL